MIVLYNNKLLLLDYKNVTIRLNQNINYFNKVLFVTYILYLIALEKIYICVATRASLFVPMGKIKIATESDISVFSKVCYLLDLF